MLATLVPCFDKNRKVFAYSLLTQKSNFLLNPQFLATAKNDGACEILGFQVIQTAGINTISPNANIIVRITEFNLYTDIAEKCIRIPQTRLILLLSGREISEEKNLQRIIALKKQGFHFAMKKLCLLDYHNNINLLKQMDYFFFDAERENIAKICADVPKYFPCVSICAYNVNSLELFEKLKNDGFVSYYEGSFHRVPSHESKELLPVKTTLIDLINETNKDDFDMQRVSKIISRDAALTIELIKMVNHMTLNHGISTINHAAAMLGQTEFIHWIHTIVAKKLCADRPTEIMHSCMIRAKFMEQMAPLFHLAQYKEEFYLAGLFSVMDIILDISTEEVFALFRISDSIKDAILSHKGIISPAYELLEAYLDANWQGVSRILILYDINDDDLYQAYLHALDWYDQIMQIT